MKEKAVSYYRQGYNCSQCILKAAEAQYRVTVSKQGFAMCQGVNTGFGIGGFCSVLIAGIMVFGLLFDQETVKRLRVRLLTAVQDKHGSLNCSQLIKERKRNSQRCEALIGEVAGIVDELIKDELE